MKQLFKALALVLVLVFAMSGAAMAATYTVGTNPEFPPFEYVGDDGEVTGIDVDIINALMAIVDPEAEVVIESMAFDALLPSLATGQIDIAIAGMSATEERRQSVDFTDAYFVANQAILVKADDDTVTTAEDLAGKTVGVVLGYTGDLYITDNVADAQIERYDKGVDAVQDLVAGRLDAVVIDNAPAESFANSTGGAAKIGGIIETGEVYAIALPKGSDELCAKMNEGLKQLTEDGTIDAIVTKFIAAE